MIKVKFNTLDQRIVESWLSYWYHLSRGRASISIHHFHLLLGYFTPVDSDDNPEAKGGGFDTFNSHLP